MEYLEQRIHLSGSAQVQDAVGMPQTIQVDVANETVPGSQLGMLPVRLIHQTASLSYGRYSPAATTVGNKALFAGGGAGSGDSNLVDIYDNSSGTWSTAKLSAPRYGMAATTVGNKAIFAGGGNGFTQTDIVDIYDDTTGKWSTAKLSQKRDSPVATTAGSKALFAGGNPSTAVVDVYDDSNGRWSTTTLPHPGPSVAASIGNMAFFAGSSTGGAPNGIVDIYNATTGQWSSATLSHAAYFATATSVGNKIIFAAGFTGNGSNFSSIAVVYDVGSNQSSTVTLAQARIDLASTTVGEEAFFAGGEYQDGNGLNHASDVVDIYDAETDQWSTTSLFQPRSRIAGTHVGDKAIFAGGYDPASAAIDPETNAVDIFIADTIPPTAMIVSAPTLKRTRLLYTFVVSYHDANRLNFSSLDSNDIIVTGPNGFSGHAQFVAETSGKHASTRIVTYTLRDPGRRWDASDNGNYDIHLQDGQVRDVAGNSAIGRRIGTFTVAIPISPQVSSPPTTPSATSAFQTKRKINDLLWQ